MICAKPTFEVILFSERMASPHPKRTLTLHQYAEELRDWLKVNQQIQMANYSSYMYLTTLACQAPQSVNPSLPQTTNNTTAAGAPNRTPNNQQRQQTPPRQFPENAGKLFIY